MLYEEHAGDSIIFIYLTCKMSKTDFKSSIDLVSQLRPVSYHVNLCMATPGIYCTCTGKGYYTITSIGFVCWHLPPHMTLLDPRPNPWCHPLALSNVPFRRYIPFYLYVVLLLQGSTGCCYVSVQHSLYNTASDCVHHTLAQLRVKSCSNWCKLVFLVGNSRYVVVTRVT